jgi:PBSX family phage portal protein
MTSNENARAKLTAALNEYVLAAKEDKEALSSKQIMEEGTFTADFMSKNEILKPTYDPSKLYKIVEDSSILPQCIDAMVLNTDGFGHQFFYTGSSELENSDKVLEEKENLEQFFRKVNEKESFTTIRKSMRRDLEATGNGYIEVIRFATGKIGIMYHVDSRYVRLQKKQKEYVRINVPMFREGKVRQVAIEKRFRRFVMVTSTGQRKYKWFKEYGDSRKMNSTTGKYQGEEGFDESAEMASELLHFKVGNGAYGVPRWAGNAVTAVGLHSADFVNYDLFENQVVPPLAIMVSGGKLTSESVEDITKILVQKKGVENFNKVLILEAMSEGSISEKQGIKIDLKELSSARKEDSMFTNYVDSGEHRLRGSFRLPPLYLGRADTYSKSTADSSKMVAEEQVFVPERTLFDELINLTIMEELNSKYHEFKSKGPRLITGEQIIEGFNAFGKLGVFTINEGIRLANRTLGLDITLYEDEWANYPIAIVVELARMGMLAGIDEISNATSTVTDILDGIDDDEKAMKAYKVLTAMNKKLSEYANTRVEREREVVEEVL